MDLKMANQLDVIKKKKILRQALKTENKISKVLRASFVILCINAKLTSQPETFLDLEKWTSSLSMVSPGGISCRHD